MVKSWVMVEVARKSFRAVAAGPRRSILRSSQWIYLAWCHRPQCPQEHFGATLHHLVVSNSIIRLLLGDLRQARWLAVIQSPTNIILWITNRWILTWLYCRSPPWVEPIITALSLGISWGRTWIDSCLRSSVGQCTRSQSHGSHVISLQKLGTRAREEEPRNHARHPSPQARASESKAYANATRQCNWRILGRPLNSSRIGGNVYFGWHVCSCLLLAKAIFHQRRLCPGILAPFTFSLDNPF